MRRMTRIAPVAAAFVAVGCVTIPREAGPPAAPMEAAPAGFGADIRFLGSDSRIVHDEAALTATLGRMRAAADDGSLDILALSGGGAGGAFGAGALVGLTRAHARPQYEIVTGVSTGALIAPFAFLGPDWDARLEEAYTGPLAEHLLRRRGLGALFEPGVYRGEPLMALVDHFVTPDLIAAVARESARGRSLLVSTTNLDSQDTVIWDMGRIAAAGGEPARTLFRDVLVASASVPGVFPPQMISVDAGGQHFEEMHVDGGASTPFFVVPQILALWRDPTHALRGGHVYVIVNGQIDSHPSATPLNTVPIVARSFETMLMFQSRTALMLTGAFAERNGLEFRFTRIPGDYDFGGSLDFGNGAMQRLFDFAEGFAQSGRLWMTRDEAMEQRRAGEGARTTQPQAAPPRAEQ